MQENIIGARAASFISLSYYNRLKNLVLSGMEDTDEYNAIISRLKKYVKVENEQYSLVTKEELDNYFKYLENAEISDSLDGRCYLKLKERKKETYGSLKVGDKILFSSVISSKIYIDVLKDVEEKINSLEENDVMDNEDIEMIKTYHINYMFHYFTSNKFLEQIAINNKFNINNIPRITFEEIEEVYNIKFIDNIQNIIYNYIVESIDELANFETEDKYLLSYISIFEVARVKVMLPYLNKENLEKIMELFKTNKYSYDKNGSLRKVKKLVKKRKEEFSE